MSLHRATLVVLATLFTAGTSSMAFAGCCGWGVSAPLAYNSGCGGCGAAYAPVAYVAPVVSPCCAVAAPVVYAQPVAPALLAYSGCGCGRSVVYTSPLVEPTPIAPSPIYVVNQGPAFSGPGISVPYHTYSPAPAYTPPYPYVPGYGPHPYYPRLAYARPYMHPYMHPYMRPRYYGPALRWRGYGYPRVPFGVR